MLYTLKNIHVCTYVHINHVAIHVKQSTIPLQSLRATPSPWQQATPSFPYMSSLVDSHERPKKCRGTAKEHNITRPKSLPTRQLQVSRNDSLAGQHHIAVTYDLASQSLPKYRDVKHPPCSTKHPLLVYFPSKWTQPTTTKCWFKRVEDPLEPNPKVSLWI